MACGKPGKAAVSMVVISVYGKIYPISYCVS